MKKFVLLMAALILGAAGAMADVLTPADLEAEGFAAGHYYRFKSYSAASSFPYLSVGKEDPYDLVGAAYADGDEDQIWEFVYADGGFYLKTMSGHYVAGTSVETHTATSTTDPVLCGMTKISDGVYSPYWGQDHASGANGHCWYMNTDGSIKNWGPWTMCVQYEIEEVIMGLHSLDENETYSVKNKSYDQWAAANLDNEMVSLEELNETGEWKFIPVSGDETYYVLNVSTGLYAQSSAEAKDGYPVLMGETPVEYRVVRDTNEGSSTYGYWGLASTDQPEINFDNANCVGWNLVQDKHYVTGYSAQMGVNPKSFWTIEKFVNPTSHALAADVIYTIKNRNFDQWAQGVGEEILSTETIDEACKWQFIPTEKGDCYYVLNVATGLYAQSSAEANEGQGGLKIELAATPVEYHVLMDTNESSSTYGYWGLCSTEQNEINFDNEDCIGWNLVQGDHYVTGYNAVMGVNAKSFWVISEWRDPVTHSLRADKLYTIKNRNYDHYAQDGTGQVLASQAITDLNKWQFIPTENDECYYIKSYTSGMYVQGCVKSYNGATVKLGNDPVEYHVLMDTIPGNNTYGYYGLASTNDQTSYNFDDQTCIGWNLAVKENESFVTSYNAQMGVNPKSFWVISEYTNNAIVTIKNRNFDQYVYVDENGTDGLFLAAEELPEGVESARDDEKYMWELVPTDNEGCYYMKHVSSGFYAQSSAAASNGAKVLVGEEPVEYSVMLDTTEGNSTYGYYGFASTDQTVTDFSNGNCIGWNLVQNSGYVTGYSAQMGVNAKSFWTVDIVRGELPTAIQNVSAQTTRATVIYNLAGQRLSQLQRGINIVGGKKYFVK